MINASQSFQDVSVQCRFKTIRYRACYHAGTDEDAEAKGKLNHVSRHGKYQHNDEGRKRCTLVKRLVLATSDSFDIVQDDHNFDGMRAGIGNSSITGIDFGRKLTAIVEVDGAGCLLHAIYKHGPDQRVGRVEDKDLFVPCKTLDDLEDTAIVDGCNVWNLRRNVVDVYICIL